DRQRARTCLAGNYVATPLDVGVLFQRQRLAVLAAVLRPKVLAHATDHHGLLGIARMARHLGVSVHGATEQQQTRNQDSKCKSAHLSRRLPETRERRALPSRPNGSPTETRRLPPPCSSKRQPAMAGRPRAQHLAANSSNRVRPWRRSW